MNQLGVIGLGTMGANLARNAARNGADVVVFNRTKEKTEEFMKNYKAEGSFTSCATLDEFMNALKPPRAILLMVKAGSAVDDLVDELSKLEARSSCLAAGDILIDGGNSHYKDTERREKELAAKGIHFIGMGVSGGEEGALNGPSMMPGGSKDAAEMMMPLFQKMAADDGAGGKCITYIGPGGAGHFVKMVHNGIEYGIMQLIAECYHILKELGGCSNAELATLFDEWNTTPYLKSFLIEITGAIFKAKDGNDDLVDVILDKAGQKGTGKWTTEAAMDYGVAIPIITAAVDARIISGAKDFRVQRSKEAPFELIETKLPKKDGLAHLTEAALELAMVSAYAEGFLLMSTTSTEEKWNLPLSEIARIWRGGCIIRSGIVEKYQAMFADNKDVQTELRMLFSGEKHHDWRTLVMLALGRGIPVPALAASLTSYDAYRTARLPQNLIQAQRDFFGAHGFEKIGKEGQFHGKWK